jgi:hypothetical protein
MISEFTILLGFGFVDDFAVQLYLIRSRWKRLTCAQCTPRRLPPCGG